MDAARRMARSLRAQVRARCVTSSPSPTGASGITDRNWSMTPIGKRSGSEGSRNGLIGAAVVEARPDVVEPARPHNWAGACCR